MTAAIVKAISLWQPWASLIFARDSDGNRIKVHETRHWRPPEALIGQRIVIHAAKTVQGYGDVSDELHDICSHVFPYACAYRGFLPLGAALGHALLKSCVPTAGPVRQEPASEDDHEAGNWGPGRFAWRLEDPQLFPEPIPFKGAQSFFNWDAQLGAVP